MVLNDILNAANLYADGLAHVQERRKQWLEKYKDIREYLKTFADHLNNNATYKQGFYVDTNHAFNEEIHGTCSGIPSLTFRSGDMPMQISFRNSGGERREYIEEGFYIVFTPTVTGQILIMLLPHYTSVSEEKPDYINLAVVDNPANLTEEVIGSILARGIEMAFYSSFTGMVELQKREMHETQKQQKYSPIGFKRHESTEKVN